MINAQYLLGKAVQKALQELYKLGGEHISFQKTRKEFPGDFTLVTFPYTRQTKKSPEQLAAEIGLFIQKEEPAISGYNVVKGFLNISMSDEFWLEYFETMRDVKTVGFKNPESTHKHIMIEYSSPNTNKPLHLGHIRNNLLGYSVARILEACGHAVVKVNLVNDRGIHICKSMLAWKKWGQGETPEKAGVKGDHLVGKYYVMFDKAYKKQIQELVAQGKKEEDAEKEAPLITEAQEMLREWEANNKEVVALWERMNGWVYDGFAKTYADLGVAFDKMYFESNTYLLGKEVVEEGLNKGVFYRKPNNSVAIDLTAEGLDEKIVLRADGTSVYITQDIGTAIERFREFPQLSQLIYTVGNEQDYHFKVLFKILERLGYAWARECYHLSYGMVELPEGKMKSREGTVVDADELIEEMIRTAEETTKALGKVEGFSGEELKELYRMIGLGALKYFILKVDPKKKMLFDPKESIDFNGHTGPFIQYTHARISSILRKADVNYREPVKGISLNDLERELIKFVYEFEGVIEEAGSLYNPALVANHIYELVKCYNRFFHDHSILKAENDNSKIFRIQLSKLCGQTIANGMSLLGIAAPERM